MKCLRTQLSSLQRRNTELVSELGEARQDVASAQPEEVDKSASKTRELQSKVRKLEKEVSQLKAVRSIGSREESSHIDRVHQGRAKDKRKIEKVYSMVLTIRELIPLVLAVFARAPGRGERIAG